MTYRLAAMNGLDAVEAAGRNLSFSAGAVSQMVRKLGASPGVPLLRRPPAGLLPTPGGEACLPRVAAAFDALTEAIAPDVNARKVAPGVAPSLHERLPPRSPAPRTPLRRSLREVVRGGGRGAEAP